MTADDFDVDGDFYEGSLTDADTDSVSTETVTESRPGSPAGKAAKQVSKLAGRLGFGVGAVAATSEEARLSSVVSESVEGPALDLLRSNSKFALPGGQSWVMLVLPTVGDFGGLNRRVKDEAKGQIIQMIYAEAMDTVVTKDLLIDDALGFVPNTKTLTAMREFNVLTNARYTFGAVCVDDLTGGPKVFAVPAMTADLGTTGRVYEAALQVSNGSAELDELISPWVIEAMLAVYRDPNLAHGDGDAALNKAVEANMALTVEYATRSSWPTPVDFVQNLAEKFPTAPIEIKPGAGIRRTATTVIPATAPIQVETDTDTDTETDQGQADLIESVDREVIEPVEQEEVSTEIQDESPAPTDVIESEGDDGDEDAPDFGASSPAPVRVRDEVVSRPDQAQGLDRVSVATIVEAIESLKADLSRPVNTTEGGLPMAAPIEQGPGTVVPGSQFTYDEMVAAAGRRYLNTDLGLFIDETPFRERLTWPVPTIEVPATGVTPWLGEQVETLTAALNAQIKASHESAIRALYRKYAELADASAAEVNRMFSPDQNPDSKWGQAYANLAKDKAAMSQNNEPARIVAENKIREMWEARKRSAIADQVARFEQQFDHRNAARIEAEVREAGERIINNAEIIHEQNLADCNRMRGVEAREMMDQSVSDVLALLDKQASVAQKQITDMVESASDSIRAYIDENRANDLDHASAIERNLAADNRLAEARSEASSRVAAIADEADKRIAAMQADMDRRAAEQIRQLEINQQTMEMTVANERARTQALDHQLSEQKRISKETMEFQQEAAHRQIQIAEATATAAINDKEAYIVSQERRSQFMLVSLVLAVIIVGAVAFLAGWVL